MEKKTVVGIDIGGTKCAVILAKADDNTIDIIEKTKLKTDKTQPALEIIDEFSKVIDKFLETEKIDAIGISCGGPLDSKKGIIMRPPNLPMWDDIHIVEILQKKYNVPVRLQNDANACALAEWLYGAGKGTENMIFMTFGTGLGAGLILGGRLYTGTNDNAGEAGHIRLSDNGPVGYCKAGSFEGFCSGGGIAQLGYTLGLEAYQQGKTAAYYNPEIAPQGITAKTVGDAAEVGDEIALEVYKKCGEYLGRGLSVLIDILNPEKIVLGSIFKRSRDIIWPHAEKVIEKEALSYSRQVCQVVPAELDENLGDFAAVTTAMYDK